VQLKPGTTVEAAELLGFVAERTPERAASPVEVYFIDALPLTAVGKVFKPALRWDAARRAVTRLLAGLRGDGGAIGVEVGPHAEHGSLITLTIEGASAAERAMLERQIGERLDPLVMRHAIVWR